MAIAEQEGCTQIMLNTLYAAQTLQRQHEERLRRPAPGRHGERGR
jgi:hypothetical protein